jgi:hypothetical protein
MQGTTPTDGLYQWFTDYTVHSDGGTEVRLELPAATTFYWCMILDGCTLLPRAATTLVRGRAWWSLPFRPTGPGVVVKLTAYRSGDKGVNVSLGTALFRVQSTLTAKSRYTGVTLRIPDVERGTGGREHKLKLKSIPKGVEVVEDQRFKRAVDDMFAELPGTPENLNQYAMISWQFPFRVPGWLGFRELADPVPGWLASLRTLEWHGLSVYGFEKWDAVTSTAAKLDVFSAAVAVAAYSSGYDHETVDDRSKPWCSFGTGKDCDDFASQVCSLVTSVVGQGQKLGGDGLWQFANEYFDTETLMVAGSAKPHFDKPDTIGHMWCEVRLKKDLVLSDVDMYDINGNTIKLGSHVLRRGDRFPIECTCGVTFFGTPLCGNGAGFDLRYGSISSYYNRESLQSASAAYVVARPLDNVRSDTTLVWPPAITKHNCHGMTYPWWWDNLRYTTPSADADDEYSVGALKQVPSEHSVHGVYSVRLIERLLGRNHPIFDRSRAHGNGVHFARLLPFANDTMWFIGDTGAVTGAKILCEIRHPVDNEKGSF